MKKLSLLFVASAIAVGSAYACGGEEPAKNPNDVGSASASATTSSAPSATADMPSATVSATATASTPPPPPEPPPIVIEGVKVTGKGKDGKALAVEVKADGTVQKDGKTTIATFAKNQLNDDKGAAYFTVGLDNKITFALVPAGPFAAFNDKDEMVTTDGKPLVSVADDGTVTMTDAKGKAEKLPYKFDKLPPKSKRAAVLLAAMLSIPKPAAAPAAGSASAAPSAKPSAAPSAAPKK